jgi:G3E family GTPase
METPMPIPVLIITGFLGTGKTSLLSRLLPLCGEAGVRPALIINEVGDVDVDGHLLAEFHAEQARLVGGCVCCTLQAQLAATLDDLLARDAGDVIIIECSGMSDPYDVISLLSMPALLSRLVVAHVLCLLDASRVEKMLSGLIELARAQARAADVLVLNKTDRLDADRREDVYALARAVNPHAQIHWAAGGDPGRAALLRLLTGPLPTRDHHDGGHGCPHCAHDDHHHQAHTHALPASFCTVALPLPASMTRPALDALLAALPDNVIRAKGFALLADEGWHVLQKVYDATDIYPYGNNAPSTGPMLICIGQHLQADALMALLK